MKWLVFEVMGFIVWGWCEGLCVFGWLGKLMLVVGEFGL